MKKLFFIAITLITISQVIATDNKNACLEDLRSNQNLKKMISGNIKFLLTESIIDAFSKRNIQVDETNIDIKIDENLKTCPTCPIADLNVNARIVDPEGNHYVIQHTRDYQVMVKFEEPTLPVGIIPQQKGKNCHYDIIENYNILLDTNHSQFKYLPVIQGLKIRNKISVE